MMRFARNSPHIGLCPANDDDRAEYRLDADRRVVVSRAVAWCGAVANAMANEHA